MLAAATAALALVAEIADVRAGIEPQVAGLQVAMKAEGLYRGRVDAVPGPNTRSAVRKLQRREGLRVDGIAGPRTREELGRLGRPLFGKRMLRQRRIDWDVSRAPVPAPPARVQGRRDRRRARPAYRCVARRFQRWARLAVDGTYGPTTRAELLVAPNSARVRTRVRKALVYWAKRNRSTRSSCGRSRGSSPGSSRASSPRQERGA